MNALSNWPRNRLLLALPSRNLKRLVPELEHIRCQRGQVLMDADRALDHTFFPAKTSSVRLLVQIPGGAAKISRAAFARTMGSMPAFRNLMSTYIHAFL